METSKNIDQPRSAGAGDARVSSGWLRFNENTNHAHKPDEPKKYETKNRDRIIVTVGIHGLCRRGRL